MKSPPGKIIEPFSPSKINPQVSKMPNLGMSVHKDILVNEIHTMKTL